jgi:hypothetical protein
MSNYFEGSGTQEKHKYGSGTQEVCWKRRKVNLACSGLERLGGWLGG